MPEEAYVRTEERDGVTVVSFPDDSALDAARVEQIQRELYAIVEACGHGIIVLDFSEVQFFSSRSIGVLIQLRKKADAAGARLALSSVRSELRRVFHVTRLVELFQIFDDTAAAIAALKK